MPVASFRTAALVALPREAPFPQSRKHTRAVDTYLWQQNLQDTRARSTISTSEWAAEAGKLRQSLGCAPPSREVDPPVTHSDCRLGSSHSASAGIPRSWLLCSILKGERERSVKRHWVLSGVG